MTANAGDAVLLYGTAIAWHGRGILLRGPSGAGKSDLALRVIAAGGMLVADDQVLATNTKAGVIAAAPPEIAGLIELRGAGLVRLPYLSSARLALVFDLVPLGTPERLPELGRTMIAGAFLPSGVVAPFESSAVEKIVAVLRAHPDF